MKKYIDCDGVILDTESHLFDEYYRIKENNPVFSRVQYLQEMDWKYWLEQAAVLQDAIAVLRSYDCHDADILTKVHSLQEAREKIIYFRSRGVKNNIIIVPNDASKTQMVCAKGAILVDNDPENLFDWKANEGVPIYFGEKNLDFCNVQSLEEIMNPKQLRKVFRNGLKKR